MKFDDSEEDYFLHDFSSKQTADARDEVSDKGNGSAPSFDFTSGSGGSGNGEVKPVKKRSRFWLWFFVIVGLMLAMTVTVRYFVPYVTESRVTGYVTLVEKRGIVFPTFEGEMISESQLADTTRIYSRDVYFSIPDDDLALRLQQYQGCGRPVTVTFKRYYGTLPWRGASNNIAVDFQEAEKNN